MNLKYIQDNDRLFEYIYRSYEIIRFICYYYFTLRTRLLQYMYVKICTVKY